MTLPVGFGTGLSQADRLAAIEVMLFAAAPAGGYSSPFTPLSGSPVTQVLTGSTDAITAKSGKVIINASGVDACTLANPVAGSQQNGGDDGKSLIIFSNTAQAHTITTGANGLNGNTHIATLTGAIGNFLELFAWNGQWCVFGSKNVTLS